MTESMERTGVSRRSFIGGIGAPTAAPISSLK